MPAPRDIQERTFEFAIQIVALCRDLELVSGFSRPLADQLFRAGTSIGAKVEEAHGNHHRPDFIAKMSAANQDAREAQYWLRLLTATGVVPKSRLAELTDESSQLVAILTTIIKRSKENVSAT